MSRPERDPDEVARANDAAAAWRLRHEVSAAATALVAAARPTDDDAQRAATNALLRAERLTGL
jgi:hypothetical protein